MCVLFAKKAKISFKLECEQNYADLNLQFKSFRACE